MTPYALLNIEARSLLARLEQVSPFSLTMPMTRAATISEVAMRAVDAHLEKAKRGLQHSVEQFLAWLKTAEQQRITPEKAQARFALLKLRFNQILDQLDIFADVLAQRAEHRTGTWVAGLDALAEDALRLSARLYTPPPVMCFLERGHGAAIRRARTRLPGGDLNPVAVIQVPRERMVGSGIGASLIHEVGHQGASLLALVETLRPELQRAAARDPDNAAAWKLYAQWLSEILADVWAIAHLGIGATQGLINVVSLPRYFVFRMPAGDDPHPFPWIRVKISLAFGRLFFPDPQWASLEKTWHALYPLAGLPPQQAALVQQLLAVLPRFASLVANHRTKHLKGQRLADVLPVRARQPAQLTTMFRRWQQAPDIWLKQPPSLVFAVAGQAKASGRLSPQAENQLLTRCLTHWAQRHREAA